MLCGVLMSQTQCAIALNRAVTNKAGWRWLGERFVDSIVGVGVDHKSWKDTSTRDLPVARKDTTLFLYRGVGNRRDNKTMAVGYSNHGQGNGLRGRREDASRWSNEWMNDCFLNRESDGSDVLSSGEYHLEHLVCWCYGGTTDPSGLYEVGAT